MRVPLYQRTALKALKALGEICNVNMRPPSTSYDVVSYGVLIQLAGFKSTQEKDPH